MIPTPFTTTSLIKQDVDQIPTWERFKQIILKCNFLDNLLVLAPDGLIYMVVSVDDDYVRLMRCHYEDGSPLTPDRLEHSLDNDLVDELSSIVYASEIENKPSWLVEYEILEMFV